MNTSGGSVPSFTVTESSRTFRRRRAATAPDTARRADGVPSGDVSAVDPLHAYVARSCPVKVQHRFAPPPVPPRELPQLEPFFEVGIAHEHVVNTEHAQLVDVVEVDGGTQATIDALQRGVAVLAGGTLPTDDVGRRVGRPDWLVRARRRSTHGRPGYWPVDIKAHKATQPAGATTASKHPALIAPLDRPAAEQAELLPGWFERSDSTRRVDLLQLAHCWRMLEACGHAPQTDGPVWGGIIGTEKHIVWTDLAVPRFRPSRWLPSDRTPGRLLSALELYDIEFAYRLDIARAAQAHVADPASPLLVEPAKISECDSCRWWPACSDELAADGGHLSLVPGLTPSRVRRLRANGVHSREQLASLRTEERAALAAVVGLDRIDDHVDAAWLATHRGERVYRRRGVVDTAPPRADIEIDLDVEHDTAPFAYLWGTLLTNRSGQPFPHPDRYRPFVSWDEPSDASDQALFAELWAWLEAVRCDAANQGLSVATYCWSPTERTRMLASAADERNAVLELIDHSGIWVDLLAHVKSVAVAAGGRSLKTIAKAAGFNWRDDAPSGMASVEWFTYAVAGDQNYQKRLIAYNEDDVQATRAVRDWLSTTALPSMPAR